MAYTVDDGPEVVGRVEADLDLVLRTVRRGDPALRSLVLTGGFARGEGAVLGGEPQNDYDLVAVRGRGRPREPYDAMRTRLEGRLGLHVDLAPVPAWRLRHAPPSIFWYETAARGRVLWGEDLLGRLPARAPADLEPTEGLRLLVNRAAGLLLATPDDGLDKRIQASKALLAALDARLLAAGAFAPSQTERWHRFLELRARGSSLGLEEPDWVDWAYRFKVDPDNAPRRDGSGAWRAAARTLLAAVPAALRHAGLDSLEEYARRDGLLDRLYYLRRAATVPGARRLVANPTGRVRVATLRLLEASLDGSVRPEDARRCLQGVVRHQEPTVGVLDGLRRATLQ